MKITRALVSAALLGLPTALLTHALVFGSEHAIGGALQSVALAAGSLALLAVVASHSRQAVQGSILASRLRDHIPQFALLGGASAIWFVLIELCETPHSVPLAAVGAALIAACLIVRAGISLLAQSIAGIVIAVARLLVHSQPVAVTVRNVRTAPRSLRSLAHTERLFSRPPPSFLNVRPSITSLGKVFSCPASLRACARCA